MVSFIEQDKMQLTDAQERVVTFNNEREWMHCDVKDLLLNIIEETGEAWNLIKWVDRTTQKELIAKHTDEFEDFIGDQLYLLFKIAGIAGVDSKKAFERTMAEYEERFPIEKVKGRHANIHAGGHDGKYTGE